VEGSELVGGSVEARGDPASVVPAGPEATSRAFARALLARDPDAAAALLSPEARLVTPDGTEVAGREAVRAILSQLTSSERVLEIATGRTLACERVALCTQHWRWGGPDPGARAASTARLVLARRGGAWGIVIVCPWD
jgi:ketosteroid isomerase-like protein